MLQKFNQQKILAQQHASPDKGSTIRARMLQNSTTVKMVLGLRFANSLCS